MFTSRDRRSEVLVIPFALESGFCLVFIAYVFQLFKTYHTKRGDGIALNGYLVTFITLLSYIVWSKGSLGSIKILELIVHTLTFVVIFIHSSKIRFSKKDWICFVWKSFISFTSFCQGIMGLLAAAAVYNKKYKSDKIYYCNLEQNGL